MYLLHMRQVLILSCVLTTLIVSFPTWEILTGQKKLRFLFAALIGIDLLWSGATIFDYPGDKDFWGWFFESANEFTGGAMLMSVQLMVIGTALLILVWRGKTTRILQQGYWLGLAALFLFLSVDEFFSLHESFLYWRQAYLLLGIGVIIVGLINAYYNNHPERRYVILFLGGFGLMGFGGVFLDAFSNTASIGPIPPFCSEGGLLGVSCQRYGMLEEFLELLGGTLILVGTLAITRRRIPKQNMRTPRRIIVAVGLTWFLGLIGHNWVFPTMQGNLFASPMRAEYLNGRLSIVRGEISQDILRRGETLDVTLYLRTNTFLKNNFSMSVNLVAHNPANQVHISHDDMELGQYNYPTSAWIPGLLVRNAFHLNIPQDAPTTASYYIIASIWRRDYNNSIPIVSQENLSQLDETRLVIGHVTVLPDEPAPPPTTPSNFRFDDNFRLVGYELPEQVSTGETFTARFWWSTDTDVDFPWLHFLHLYQPETQAFFPFNQEPFQGILPADTWPAGITVADNWSITLPEDMPTGIYELRTGMFDYVSGRRASVVDESGLSVPEQAVPIGQIEVHAP